MTERPKTFLRGHDGKVFSVLTDAGWQPSDGDGIPLPPPAPAPVVVPWHHASEPDAMEMAGNFTRAVARWVKAGAPVVSEADYQARSAICAPCEYWDGSARMGLGKCKAPGCGCTSLKRWLATEVCTQGKWPALPGK